MQKRSAAVGILIACLACAGCDEQSQNKQRQESSMPTATIEQAVSEAGAWTDIPGVDSVGQGEQDGKPVIRVYISRPEARPRIPQSYKNFPVIVEQGDPISIQPKKP
jgi:hypothetical protein